MEYKGILAAGMAPIAFSTVFHAGYCSLTCHKKAFLCVTQRTITTSVFKDYILVKGNALICKTKAICKIQTVEIQMFSDSCVAPQVADMLLLQRRRLIIYIPPVT